MQILLPQKAVLVFKLPMVIESTYRDANKIFVKENKSTYDNYNDFLRESRWVPLNKVIVML